MSGSAESSPVLSVLRGEATEEDVAAVTAVVLALAGGSEQPPPSGPSSAWADRARLLRKSQHPGPNQWRISAFPS